MSEFTDSQLAEGINAALQARDFHAVADLVRLLALQNPVRAREVLDVIETAIDNRRSPAEEEK